MNCATGFPPSSSLAVILPHKPQLFIKLETWSQLEVILSCCADSWGNKSPSCHTSAQFQGSKWGEEAPSKAATRAPKATKFILAEGFVHSGKRPELGSCCQETWIKRVEWRSISLIAKHFNKSCRQTQGCFLSYRCCRNSQLSLQPIDWMTGGDFTFPNTCCVKRF